MGFTKDTEANGLPTHSGEGAISSSAVIRPPQDGHGSVDKAAPEARPRRKPGGGHERPSDDDLPRRTAVTRSRSCLKIRTGTSSIGK
jgi:hypothetical protein